MVTEGASVLKGAYKGHKTTPTIQLTPRHTYTHLMGTNGDTRAQYTAIPPLFRLLAFAPASELPLVSSISPFPPRTARFTNSCLLFKSAFSLSLSLTLLLARSHSLARSLSPLILTSSSDSKPYADATCLKYSCAFIASDSIVCASARASSADIAPFAPFPC